ncbi:ribbon-helix-helix protein, CopG family [Mesorhizobium sp. STM 4661]|uniref:type II toxin-antitoxin system RelB family antitoxin n=1 Tax=Mesorhizobium sp. STM 4661 TaxID=1297570 RepID=UPI0002BDAF0F|nr:ribbon-helix-helix protein, CopG family [Mesorhizobium sp. STM 4661]CCV12727.1 CopG domain protein DNA-binding domain protein [Mesorhizobium sp. STM 4661]
MPTSIRLSPKVEQRLDFLVAKTGRSEADHVREFVERGLEDIEDYYLAAEMLERIRRGEDEIVKAEEFWRGDT